MHAHVCIHVPTCTHIHQHIHIQIHVSARAHTLYLADSKEEKYQGNKDQPKVGTWESGNSVNGGALVPGWLLGIFTLCLQRSEHLGRHTHTRQ